MYHVEDHSHESLSECLPSTSHSTLEGASLRAAKLVSLGYEVCMFRQSDDCSHMVLVPSSEWTVL